MSTCIHQLWFLTSNVLCSDFGMSRFIESHKAEGSTKTDYGPIRWMVSLLLTLATALSVTACLMFCLLLVCFWIGPRKYWKDIFLCIGCMVVWNRYFWDHGIFFSPLLLSAVFCMYYSSVLIWGKIFVVFK